MLQSATMMIWMTSKPVEVPLPFYNSSPSFLSQQRRKFDTTVNHSHPPAVFVFACFVARDREELTLITAKTMFIQKRAGWALVWTLMNFWKLKKSSSLLLDSTRRSIMQSDTTMKMASHAENREELSAADHFLSFEPHRTEPDCDLAMSFILSFTFKLCKSN